MDPEAEPRLLEEHISKGLAKYPPLCQDLQQLPTFAPQDLSKHIGSTRPHKAVLPGAAPAAAWKLCADEVASNLVQHLQETSGNAWAPRSTDCFVQLVLWQWQFARSLSVQ